MSKLAIVRQALETNPEVVIVTVQERNYLPDRDGYWSHTMDFFVAPTKGIYTADGLQDFMMGLIPDLKPTCTDRFWQGSESLEFGKLYFDEKIGNEQITRICTLADQELLNASGFMDGKRKIEETEDYQRRTWVRLFPDQKIAADILEGKLDGEYHINMDHLRMYQPNLLQRMLSRR